MSMRLLLDFNWHSFIDGENQILESVFLHVLDTGIFVSYLIAAIILVRLLFRNMPKNIRFIVWILAGICLVFPYSAESAYSLVPVRQHLDTAVMHSRNVTIDTGIPVINESVSRYLQQYDIPVTSSANPPLAFIVYVCARVWIFGMLIMAGYMLFSWWKLKRRLRTAVPQEIETDGEAVKIYRSEKIESPFLFGMIHPKIYLPYSISDKDITYIIIHEVTHKKRRDYLIKPAGYLVLACYWFHPLVWVSYILMCTDMELACDEAVIKKLGAEYKKAYSQALLSCSVSRKSIAACPAAFGENNVKKRIRSILSYKKPAIWVIVLSSAVCAALVICFMTQKTEVVKKDVPNTSNIEGIVGKSDESKSLLIKQDTVKDGQNMKELQNTIEDSQSLEESPIKETLGEAVNIRAYFSDPHNEPEYTMMEADLDDDGYPEKIVMSDLGYNGGDGGYKIEIFRVKNGAEEKISLPDEYNEETGFPFEIIWTGQEAELLTPKNRKIAFSSEKILDIYEKKGDEEQLRNLLENTDGLFSEYPSDAVSGFTVAEDTKDHKPVIIIKQYLMGCLGHADCFGYAVSYLKLLPDDSWETEYVYLQDS